MRVHPQGHLEIGRIREGLYRTLRGDVERELSPEWRGVEARHQPLSSGLVLWTAAGLVLLLLTLVYFGLQGAINRRSDATLAAFLAAPPKGPASLRPQAPPQAPQPPPQTTPPPPPPVVRASVPLQEQISRLLAPEIRGGALEVSPTDGGFVIRIRNKGLFASGSATLDGSFVALFERIGQSLKEERVTVEVIGHTDNVPINTLRFPSNWELSRARAETVSEILRRAMPPEAIRVDGRGDTQPVAPNDTAAGREQNRRTEIVVAKREANAPAPGPTPNPAPAPSPAPSP